MDVVRISRWLDGRNNHRCRGMGNCQSHYMEISTMISYHVIEATIKRLPTLICEVCPDITPGQAADITNKASIHTRGSALLEIQVNLGSIYHLVFVFNGFGTWRYYQSHTIDVGWRRHEAPHC